jgi:hypothetical protein
MSETRTATFIVFEDSDEGGCIEVAAAGDHGEGDELLERVEAAGRGVVSIYVCDVSDVPSGSAFWELGVLGPRPEIANALGGMTGEMVQRET